MDDRSVTWLSQEVIHTTGLFPALTTAIREILLSLNPREVLVHSLQCALRFTGSAQATIALKHDDRFIIETAWSATGEVEEARGRVAPRESISAMLAKTLKPVSWVADKTHPRTDWLTYASFIGVPILTDSGDMMGSLVLSYDDNATWNDETILIAEMIAGTFYGAYKKALAYENSVETGQVIEHERLAQQLHDNAAQYIFSACMKTDQLLGDKTLGEGVRAQLEDLRALVDAAKLELRKAIHGAPETNVVGASVSAVFESEIAEHHALGGVPTTLVVEVPAAPPAEIVLIGQAVVREALSNVRKHARAALATVSFSVRGGIARISVQDDGVGISRKTAEVDTTALHFGLNNLKRLVEKAGGSFSVGEADEGIGTAVLALIPLERGVEL